MTGTLSRGLVAFALLGAIAGCSHDSSNTNNNGSSLPTTTLRLTLRVLDGQNGGPVQNATLTVCGFGSASSDGSGFITLDLTNLTDSTDNTNFGFSGRIDAPGYASQSFSDNTDTASEETDGSDITISDVGIIFLNRARTLNVVVTKDGSPVAGAAVVALLDPDSKGGGPQGVLVRDALSVGSGGSGSGTCQVVMASTTNGSGIATFQVDGGTSAGIASQFTNGEPFFIASSQYHIVVPAQNLSGGPGFDFATTQFFDPFDGSGNYNYGEFGDTIAIALQPSVDPQQPVNLVSFGATEFNTNTGFLQGAIEDVTSSASPYGQSVLGSGARSGFDVDVDGDASVFSTDGSVTMVFQTPVTVINDPTKNFVTKFFFRDGLTTPVDDLSSPDTQVVTGTASAVAGTLNTVWKFTPPTAIPLNAEYFIQFYVTSDITDFQNGDLDNAQIEFFDTSDDGEFFYYHAPAPTSIADPTMDNYNGATNSTVTARAYLEFSEQGTGTYAVLGFTDSNGTFDNVDDTSGDNSVFINSNASVSMVFNVDTAPASTDAQLGGTAGTRFRIPLQFSSNDGQESLEDGATVVVAVNVVDAKGNRLNKTFNLTVK